MAARRSRQLLATALKTTGHAIARNQVFIAEGGRGGFAERRGIERPAARPALAASGICSRGSLRKTNICLWAMIDLNPRLWTSSFERPTSPCVVSTTCPRSSRPTSLSSTAGPRPRCAHGCRDGVFCLSASSATRKSQHWDQSPRWRYRWCNRPMAPGCWKVSRDRAVDGGGERAIRGDSGEAMFSSERLDRGYMSL